MKTLIDNLAYALDKLRVSRRIGFFFTLWITYYSVTEMVEFAEFTHTASLDLAAIILAITGPVTALQGFVLKEYYKGHRDTQGGD